MTFNRQPIVIENDVRATRKEIERGKLYPCENIVNGQLPLLRVETCLSKFVQHSIDVFWNTTSIKYDATLVYDSWPAPINFESHSTLKRKKNLKINYVGKSGRAEERKRQRDCGNCTNKTKPFLFASLHFIYAKTVVILLCRHCWSKTITQFTVMQWFTDCYCYRWPVHFCLESEHRTHTMR